MQASKKIGLNLLYMHQKFTGGSTTYAVNLIKELSKIDSANKYIIYINKDCIKLPFKVGPNFKVRVIPFRNKNVFIRYFWEQAIFPFLLIRDRLNLLHSPGYVGPVFCPVPHIVSILDLNYKRHKESMSLSKRILLGLMVEIMSKLSKHIITISNFSKKEIIKVLNIKEHKITVTLLSGSNDDHSSNESVNLNQIYKINSKYIIAFGGYSAHKNMPGLIAAFKPIADKVSDLQLVLVGNQHNNSELQEKINNLNLNGRVIFTGFVPDAHVLLLLQKSLLFVFPSFYEGFGIPLLDAQSVKVPIASSNAGSLPEVGGSGALYFDPNNTTQMTDTITNILENPQLSENLIKQGCLNREKFHWAVTAEQTLSCYNTFTS